MSNTPTSTWRDRLSSPLTWHFVGAAILLLVVIGLAVRVGPPRMAAPPMPWPASRLN